MREQNLILIYFGETVNTVPAGNANQSEYYINIISLGIQYIV